MNFKRVLFVVFALALATSFSSTRLAAQTTTTGAIVGTVTDPSGAVVPNARVDLSDNRKHNTRTTQTGAEGIYEFSLLLPSNYTITVTAAGFQTSKQAVEVPLGSPTTVNFSLSVAAAGATITVTETAPLLQTETGNVSSTVSETQAANIPNPGNDLTAMVNFSPGTVVNTAGGGLGNFSSYGISATANLFTVNGMDDNDPFLNLNNSGATNLMLGQNEVQEVAVVTNGYSGQYGGLAGANINYVTRGGTNQFHGRAAYYWNGRTMNANSWFNNAKATPRSFVNANQYGGDLGGPILKDKLFGYFNAEGLYLVIPTSVQALIPSPAFAAATQTNIQSIFGVGSPSDLFYKNIFSLYAGAPGASRATNSLSNGGCDPSASEAGSALSLQGFGQSNPCVLAFQSNVSNKTHEHLEAGRVDWNVTSKDKFFGRIQHDRGLQASVTDAINPLFNIVSDQPEWQGQFEETHVFSGSLVNQLIVSSQWYRAIFGQANPAASFALFPTTLIMAGGQLSDVGGIDFAFPQGRNITQGQISDDFSWTRGAHGFKFGFKFRRNWTSDHDFGILSTGILEPLTLDALFEGGLDPVTAASGFDFSVGVQGFPRLPEARMQNYATGGYVEDDWKATPNLTLTFSFRLDHQSNPICVQKCFVQSAVPFPSLSTSTATPYNQLVKINQRRMLPDLTTVEPQPRFGFAWQPHLMGMHNIVVRGGVGIFYDLFPAVQFDAFAENPPNDPSFVTFFDNLTPGETCGGTCSNLLLDAANSNSGFQAGFASGGSFNSISAAVPGFSAPGLASSEAHPKVPQYQKWNLEVERQFGENTSVSLQYVGNHGIHIFFLNSGLNGCNPGAAFGTLPACPNPNPSFLTVGFGQSLGVANYNGVTASFTHRYKSGLVQLNYTYSHTLDMDSNSGITGTPFSTTFFGATNNSIQQPENPFNPRQFNYGNADQDIRHSFNANYVWELPIKRFITRGHGPDRLLNGWDVNGAVFWRSGFPYTLVDNTTSASLSSTGYGDTVFGNVTAAGGTGANCKAEFTVGPNPVPQPSKDICLNTADFARSPTGFGNVGRNTFRGPRYFDSDFSIMKHTKIWERAEFVIGAQFFNVFNHPNFDAPVFDTSSSRFGQVIKTVSPPTTTFGSVLGADASPRLIQLKVMLSF